MLSSLHEQNYISPIKKNKHWKNLLPFKPMMPARQHLFWFVQKIYTTKPVIANPTTGDSNESK